MVRCPPPPGYLVLHRHICAIPILLRIARELCDSPLKQGRKSFAILSLQIWRDMKSIAAGPLGYRGISGPKSRKGQKESLRGSRISKRQNRVRSDSEWTFSDLFLTPLWLFSDFLDLHGQEAPQTPFFGPEIPLYHCSKIHDRFLFFNSWAGVSKLITVTVTLLIRMNSFFALPSSL